MICQCVDVVVVAAVVAAVAVDVLAVVVESQ